MAKSKFERTKPHLNIGTIGLPLCTFPTIHTTCANWRALSAMGATVSAGWLIADPHSLENPSY